MIQKQSPKLAYCGLTIILSEPSRMDKTELISGNAGRFFNDDCLQPEVNRWMCEIRLAADTSPLLPSTKVLLLLGEKALRGWTTSKHNLGEQRGCPLVSSVGSLPAIVSYTPQDSVDMQNYEAKYNKLHSENTEDNDKEDTSGKRHGKTDRANFRFWLKMDTKKALRILANNGNIPKLSFEPQYELYPQSDELIHILKATKNSSLYVDIETDTLLNLRCFAVSFGLAHPIYIIPVLDHMYTWTYGAIPKILAALAEAFRDNEVVAHNGAAFDFLVFAMKYRIPVGRKLYDTMLAQHRCFPLVEKSLGHCISLWTYEPYHKDEGNFAYMSKQQAEQLWYYCGKDVYTMMLVRQEIDKYAKIIRGLPESIKQANASIRPYLTMMLQGIRYDQTLVDSYIGENDLLMEQYLRMMKIMTGEKVEPLISNQKTTRYFHDMLGYEVMARTETGGASLAADALFKLKLKYENPVIDMLLRYREVQKETGILRFTPWKKD